MAQSRSQLLDKPMDVQNWGTFDVANYGDLLFPLILEAELRKRIPNIRWGVYSPQGSSFAPFPQQRVKRIPRLEDRDFPLSGMSTPGVIIGGGDIIRFDDVGLGQIYGFTENHQAEQERLYRVFMKDASLLSPWIPVLWNAVGVPYEFDESQTRLLRRWLKNVTYLSVRDESSKKRLLDCGIEKEIEVVPDTAFLISRLFPKSSLDSIKTELIRKKWLCDSDKLLCFQFSENDQNFKFESEVIHVLRGILSRQNNLRVLLLPLNDCHGDSHILQRMQKQLGEKAIWVNATSDPRVIASAIAHSNYFAGTSLHGNITAHAYGIPHLFLNFRNLSKLKDASRLLNEEQQLVAEPNTLLQALDLLFRLETCENGALAAKIIQRVDAHFDRCAEILIRQQVQKTSSQFPVQFVEQFCEELMITRQEDLARHQNQLKILCDEKDKQIGQLRAQIGQLQTQTEQLRTLVKEFRNSVSWKITASLRWVHKIFKKF